MIKKQIGIKASVHYQMHNGLNRMRLSMNLLNKRNRLSQAALLFSLFVCATAAVAEGNGEQKQICEVKPVLKCLDKAVLEGATIKIPIDAAAISSQGFLICDSSYNYVTSPDIVLIMDNTGSMDSLNTVDGIPRSCNYPDKQINDPGCISGDPHRLRGPALQTFLDSALAKVGTGINVGVIAFAEAADAKSTTLVPLNSTTINGIKSTIIMKQDGETNYTAGFQAARNLFLSSKKPKAEQFIIFVSDGRPNFPKRPDGDPYTYKFFWDSLPVVHSIFLGQNQANYKDMQDISAHTGGDFFNISDVGLLANILTQDLSKKLFRRAFPNKSTIRNVTAQVLYQLDTNSIQANKDSTYTLKMPGPLYVQKGINEISIKTEYGFGSTTQNIHFNIERAATGPYFNLEQSCRALPNLVLYNTQNQALNYLGLSYSFVDSLLRYKLTTTAPGLDSFNVMVQSTSSTSAQKDLELIPNNNSNHKDSIWTGSEPFQHQTQKKNPGDKLIQVDHGESVIVTYHNPFIREDSAQAIVKIKYGPEFGNASYLDLDGDGKIETVNIYYKEQLGNIPTHLRFHINDADGKSWDRDAFSASDEIQFAKKSDQTSDRGHIVVSLKNPFPFAVTSVSYPDTAGRAFKQLDIPMVDETFRVDDSVPPVIANATVVLPENSDGLTRIVVTYSEPITLDATSALEPIIIRRDTVNFSVKQIPIAKIEKVNDREYAFYLSANGAFKPVGGDSIAINKNGETKDLFGRNPSTLIFTAMGGAVPSQGVSDFFVTFANGSNSNAEPAPLSPDGNQMFIPVDAKGSAMPGNGDGKCENCSPTQNGLFTGSVINIVTKYPVHYEFMIYSKMGEFVAKGGGKISENDLKLLMKKEAPSRDPNLTEYSQRIVWTGRTTSGQLAGTGVYVLKATFHYEESFKTGAHASSSVQITRFGFLRSCCASSSSGWFQ